MIYPSCADTAKLLRAALRETFAGVRFSVNSKTYSGGASIDIAWTDGPLVTQVEAVSKYFEGGYFDGMIDYKGSRYHTLDGELVHFGADFIFEHRTYSDALVMRGIADVSKCYGGNSPITLEEYRRGDAYTWRNSGGCDLGRALNRWLSGDADCMTEVRPDVGFTSVRPSATLARIGFAGDDGYGLGTVGRDGSGGESCYKAQTEARERVLAAPALHGVVT